MTAGIDRGEYRAIYTALVDGPDFQALSPPARLTLFVLKVTLGAAGIGVQPGLVGALVERTGLEEGAVARALAELQDTGWIDRERNVVWLVRGLEFEPQLRVSDRKHRAGLQRRIAALPSLGIVRRFRARYAEWFDDEPPSHAEAVPSASVPPSDAAPPASDTAPDRPGSASEGPPEAIPGSFEGPSEALGSPFEGPSKALRCTEDRDRDRNRDREQKTAMRARTRAEGENVSRTSEGAPETLGRPFEGTPDAGRPAELDADPPPRVAGPPPPRDPDLDSVRVPPPPVRVAVAANEGLRANPHMAAEAEIHPLRSDLAEQPVADWLAAGIPLDLICATVREVAMRFRPNARARRIASFAYFDAAVRAAHAERCAATLRVPATVPFLREITA